MRCSAENIAFSIDKDPGKVQLEQKLEMPGFLSHGGLSTEGMVTSSQERAFLH